MTPHIFRSKKRLDFYFYWGFFNRWLCSPVCPFFFWGIPPTTTCDLNLHLHCQSHGLLDFHLISTMSYIHRVVNVLLRGLVIYAVLGLECSYSNDLPSRSSDAQNVATTGKRSPCRTQVSLIYLRMYSVTPHTHPSPPSVSLWESRGMPCAAA